MNEPRPAQSLRPLRDLVFGLERETHRIDGRGALSTRPHPPALRGGSFTRDFAETQLEIVTRPHAGAAAAHAELRRLTTRARAIAGPELLWPFSMPPRLPEEADIPLARLDRRALAYRNGLALRYGKARQMICGVHVNVSVGAQLLAHLEREAPLSEDEAATGRSRDGYALRLARNLYADLPTLVLLLGASPVAGHGSPAPFAISHRNGRGGYAGSEFARYLDLRSLDAYRAGLRRGLDTVAPSFFALGLVRDGELVQLNPHVFQTEKEFYAPIRLRQAALPGETNLQALSRRGVGYLELRLFDLDPTSPEGISLRTLRLLHLFVLDGLFRQSQPRDSQTLAGDLDAVAEVARLDPLTLAALRPPQAERFLAAARGRLADLEPWAHRLDGAKPHHARALRRAAEAALDPSALLSARIARAYRIADCDWTSFGVGVARTLAERRRCCFANTRPLEAAAHVC